jgi:uncharacterized protein
MVRIRRFAIVYVLICGSLYFLQERLLFFPSRNIRHTPSLYQLNYEEVWLPITKADGKVERIHGWWIPSANPQAPVFLYFHHNAVNIGANVSQARKFHQMGCSILLIDYRGFGQSEGGFPIEPQVYEDAQTAWNYLTQQRQIPPQQIFIYGHSVGGAIAIDLAAKQPEAAGLIVQNTFTSLRDMTKRFGLSWVLPIDLLLKPEFNSIEKIRSLQIPVLILHGTADPQIPVQMGQALFEAAPEPKKLILIPDAGHDNNMEKQYYQLIQQFMQEVQATRM